MGDRLGRRPVVRRAIDRPAADPQPLHARPDPADPPAGNVHLHVPLRLPDRLGVHSPSFGPDPEVLDWYRLVGIIICILVLGLTEQQISSSHPRGTPRCRRCFHD